MKKLLLILAVAAATLTSCKKGGEPEPTPASTPASKAVHYLTVQWGTYADYSSRKVYINGVLTAGAISNMSVHSTDVIKASAYNWSGQDFAGNHSNTMDIKIYVDGVLKVDAGTYDDYREWVYTIE
jgi:hypothetical protein